MPRLIELAVPTASYARAGKEHADEGAVKLELRHTIVNSC
jgi:hypothetical protein